MEHRKKLGFWSIVLLGINGIIGSGIFLLPNQAAALMGPLSIAVILFDAILVLSLTLCFAEAGGMFRKNGGPYVYSREAFGSFIGFEVGFMKWAIGIIAWAAMAAAFSTALGVVWEPAKEGIVKNIVVTVIIVWLGAINYLGVSVSKLLNNVITIAKLVPLLLFVAVGIFFIHGNSFTPVLPHGTYKHGAFGAAALLIFYAFTGFESLAVAAEDMKNPEKNIPKAIIMVIFICSLFYVLIQTVAEGTLGPKLAVSQAPLAQATQHFIGHAGATIILAGTLISIAGINIAASFITPRSAVALANDGLIPSFLAKNSRFGTPAWAIFFTVLFALPLALSGSFAQLAAISVVSRFAQYLPTCLSIIVLRKKRSDLTRTFKVPFGPVIPILAVIVSIWLLTQASTQQLIWGLCGLAAGIPVYFLMKLTRMKKKMAD
ncbi:APC family permease [Heyndrickxia acidicola]|uniref:APC family permease n=1 Tax=Heyndrickxia acidicola TaxID=209389 RepID=A0ABU6MS76_9BACI|nr:APC family permease [Heyndrickxia acidicola]MED1206057.1 APC family permease [Heyndrickxia acidicola]